MEHVALYRKWRPQRFDALVGQEDNANILKTAVAAKKQGHAYLFCGTRGTGKTSTARILAKALNCENPQNGEPCNVCPTCKAITEGNSLDVIEIDAASNRGIDEIRNLLEKVHFVPVQSPYKVYIIDEVHMLTTEAFNALLKTLEEPPAHVVFITATTEARKVPMTILSRCQRYDFKPISEQKLFEALKVIGAKEKLSITDDALEFLAQKAKGSMRDALSLLDQGLGNSEKTLTVSSFGRIIGSVATELWPVFLQDLANRDAAAVFSHIEDVAEEGKDMRVFFQDLQQFLGDLLCYRGETGQSYGKALAASQGLLAEDTIIALLAVIGESESAFRYHRDTKMVSRFLMAKILRTMGQQDAAPEIKPKAQAKKTAAPKVTVEEIIKPPKDIAPKAESLKSVPVQEGKASFSEPKKEKEADDSEELWSQILNEVRQKSPKTFTWLSKGNLQPIKGDTLTVQYHESDAMYQSRMALPDHSEVLEGVLETVFGRKMKVVITSDANNELKETSLF